MKIKTNKRNNKRNNKMNNKMNNNNIMLAVNGKVQKDEYQWAFFGTEPYIKGGEYSFELSLEKQRNGKYKIKSNWGAAESYLAVNGKVQKDEYQWAFFGTKSYIKNNQDKYTWEFDKTEITIFNI